jgi:hypothetical protein
LIWECDLTGAKPRKLIGLAIGGLFAIAVVLGLSWLNGDSHRLMMLKVIIAATWVALLPLVMTLLKRGQERGVSPHFLRLADAAYMTVFLALSMLRGDATVETIAAGTAAMFGTWFLFSTLSSKRFAE